MYKYFIKNTQNRVHFLYAKCVFRCFWGEIWLADVLDRFYWIHLLGLFRWARSAISDVLEAIVPLDLISDSTKTDTARPDFPFALIWRSERRTEREFNMNLKHKNVMNSRLQDKAFSQTSIFQISVSSRLLIKENQPADNMRWKAESKENK